MEVQRFAVSVQLSLALNDPGEAWHVGEELVDTVGRGSGFDARLAAYSHLASARCVLQTSNAALVSGAQRHAEIQ